MIFKPKDVVYHKIYGYGEVTDLNKGFPRLRPLQVEFGDKSIGTMYFTRDGRCTPLGDIVLERSITEMLKHPSRKNLLPCPFCGEKDMRVSAGNLKYWVWCHNCGVRTQEVCNEKEAIQMWNMRF